ncbi:MAG: DNA repair protein RadA [Bacteroidia bacterium]|nr:DNA repair protein RadA [Bacteroidia bacterium]
MSKTKTVWFCQHCGQQSPKWVGKCPSCSQWNTFVEEVLEKPSVGGTWQKAIDPNSSQPKLINDIVTKEENRIPLPDEELSRVLGGGLVPGSLVLLSGEPGIGKSTLLLQLALKAKKLKTLYVTGEESDLQVKMRAERIESGENQCYILTETNCRNILHSAQQIQPSIIIIDSIQTVWSPDVESSPGSVSQIKECATEFLKFAKQSNIPVFLIGHITKDGNIAGPKVLEHMVDTVLLFEGDRNFVFRLVRASKNRFGSTAELAIYEMKGNGLREVSNPSEVFLSQRDESLSGIAVSAMLEGIRPMLIEVQALASSAVYGTPQRSGTGFDLRRLNMLLAVLEKRCGFRLGQKDVFLSIAGGLRVDDPAIDLAVVCSVISSSEDVAIPGKYCFAAELGLSGEIRPVNRIEQRVAEAERLGFEKIFISQYNKFQLPSTSRIQVVSCKRIEEVLRQVFG